MSRKLLYIIPLILPFVLYGLYVWWAKRQSQSAGDGTTDAVNGAWSNAPWVWLGSAAVLLFIATLTATALLTGDPTAGTYVPPHVVDGKIVPGEVK